MEGSRFSRAIGREIILEPLFGIRFEAGDALQLVGLVFAGVDLDIRNEAFVILPPVFEQLLVGGFAELGHGYRQDLM